MKQNGLIRNFTLCFKECFENEEEKEVGELKYIVKQLSIAFSFEVLYIALEWATGQTKEAKWLHEALKRPYNVQ